MYTDCAQSWHNQMTPISWELSHTRYAPLRKWNHDTRKQKTKRAHSYLLVSASTDVYLALFDLLTDHRALVHTLNNRNAKLPARLKRLSLRLQLYNFVIKFTSDSANAADFLSRHPVNDGINDRTATIADDYVNFMIEVAILRAMTLFRTRQQMMRHFNRSQN